MSVAYNDREAEGKRAKKQEFYPILHSQVTQKNDKRYPLMNRKMKSLSTQRNSFNIW